MEALSAEEIQRAVELALEEDIGSGDVTTMATVPPSRQAAAAMVAREALVVAGIRLAVAAFRQLSSDLTVAEQASDGQHLAVGGVLLKISGPAGAILSAERVALNFVQRLSGVATLTAQFVQTIKGTRAQILDTRKTTPGWRRLEKYAVTCGGGRNHRIGVIVIDVDNCGGAPRQQRFEQPQLGGEIRFEV